MAVESSPEFKLAAIQGPRGEFAVAFAGAMLDGLCFLYKDEGRRFFFYAQVDFEPTWRVTVGATSTGKGSGPPIRTTPAEEARLRENVEFFFKTRFYVFPEQQLKAGESPEAVIFKWGIA